MAATPDSVSLLVEAGYDVVVQAGAGGGAAYSDQAYRMAGATVLASVPASTVDVLLHVTSLHPAVPSRLRPQSMTVGTIDPFTHKDVVRSLAESGVVSFAMDLLPESFTGDWADVVSGQELVSGYRAALEAMMQWDRMVGHVVTSAVVLPPAKVLIIGAGVVGLEAADVFRRMGAKVRVADPLAEAASDAAAVRASFTHLPRIASVGDAVAQRDCLAPYVADADIVVAATPAISTDAVALVTETLIAGMRPGSVVVDLGPMDEPHVAGSEPGEVAKVELPAGGSVKVLSVPAAANAVPATASELYSRSIAKFILAQTIDGEFVPDYESAVYRLSLLTFDGFVMHDEVCESFPDLAPPADGELTSPTGDMMVDERADEEHYSEAQGVESDDADAGSFDAENLDQGGISDVAEQNTESEERGDTESDVEYQDVVDEDDAELSHAEQDAAASSEEEHPEAAGSSDEDTRLYTEYQDVDLDEDDYEGAVASDDVDREIDVTDSEVTATGGERSGVRT